MLNVYNQRLPLTKLPAWQTLAQYSKNFLNTFNLKEAFNISPQRAEIMCASACGLYLDYSRNLLDESVLSTLFQLLEESHMRTAIDHLFCGEKVNYTEDRAATHPTLRHLNLIERPKDLAVMFDKMSEIVERLHTKSWLGSTGKPIQSIVNLGIGGSDLGPKMALAALKPYVKTDLMIAFVSNIDSAALAETLAPLDPETTLFIISSKSLTTQETLQNWHSAKKWLETRMPNCTLAQHAIVITSKPEKIEALGFYPEHVLTFPESVGGRYSIWSTIGLPLALGIGIENYRSFLQGAHEMDRHYQEAPWAHNLPAILAVIGIWYHNFLSCQTMAVIPYSHNLRYFTEYLQQLDMESNGKSVSMSQTIQYTTAPIVWGSPGTNGQHAFFQLLHQGKHLIPIDFLLPAQTHYDLEGHQTKLVANCLAQARALMLGDLHADANRTIPGNRPSTIILYPKTTPYHLGAILALYEHKIYTQSVIWQINAFDQYGVELGKRISLSLEKTLQAPHDSQEWDLATQKLLAIVSQMQTSKG